MAITPPTRTAPSLGTTKSNAQPVTNEPTQLSAAQYNVCADNLIAVINQSNANESAIAGAINVLWQWNGVDMTQFAAAGSPSYATAAWAASFAAGNSDVSRSGRQIDLAGTAGAGNGAIIYLANDPLPSLGAGAFGGNSYNYEIQIVSNDDNAMAKDFGLCLFASEEGASFHGYTYSFNTGQLGRIDNNGAWQQGGGASAGPGNFDGTDSLFRVRIMGRDGDGADPLGDYPHWRVASEAITRGGTTVKEEVFTNTKGAFDGNVGVTTPGATWNGLSCNRWGLMLNSTIGGGPGTEIWEIEDIRIVTV